ncbi:MAG TPA: DNA repair exonuclease [Candidatus Saccharimonadales bacterium]|nr:DNA repair exonuclease [Candidatus Saccharimonadales bacterium]
MLRLLHTADVHLGARHSDLGEQATAQRERQFLAFQRSIELALAEHIDLFLIAGDLFDSNTQPRRSVERVAAELRRLAQAAIRTVIIPGTHDAYDRSSIYRAHDLVAMAGLPATTDLVTILTPEQPDVVLRPIDAVVYSRVFATRRAPRSPLAEFDVSKDDRATWRIGMIHGAVSIPGRTDGDDVVITTAEIAASGLDYLALGHWHSAQVARAGKIDYAYSGAPEPVAVDQDRAGKVLLVTCNVVGGRKTVTVEERTVGRTRFEKVDLDARDVANQPALIDGLRARADPDLVLDVRLTGLRADELDLDGTEIETALAPSFLKMRFRDLAVTPLSEGHLPPVDTISGAFVRQVEARIGEAETAGDAESAGELRDVLRLGRLLLAGHEVTL